MKTNTLLALLSGAVLLAAADVPAADKSPKTSDKDKLSIREAQLARIMFASQVQSLQGELVKAQQREQAAFAEISKRLGCDIDPETADCKPKAPEAKAEPAKPTK